MHILVAVTVDDIPSLVVVVAGMGRLS